MKYVSQTYKDPKVIVLDTDEFMLDENYEYFWIFEGTRRRILVRAGFKFDGASIPWLAQLVVGKWDLGRGPPMIHDLMYQTGGMINDSVFGEDQFYDESLARWVDNEVAWKRSEADRLFARHMREAGVKKTKRRAAYLAVRIGGAGSWKDQAIAT